MSDRDDFNAAVSRAAEEAGRASELPQGGCAVVVEDTAGHWHSITRAQAIKVADLVSKAMPGWIADDPYAPKDFNLWREYKRVCEVKSELEDDNVRLRDQIATLTVERDDARLQLDAALAQTERALQGWRSVMGSKESGMEESERLRNAEQTRDHLYECLRNPCRLVGEPASMLDISDSGHISLSVEVKDEKIVSVFVARGPLIDGLPPNAWRDKAIRIERERDKLEHEAKES